MLVKVLKQNLAKVLAKALSAVLEITENDIETRLLAQNGRIRLQNVKIREKKIPVAPHGDGITCFLVIAETSRIHEFHLEWTWAGSSSSLPGDDEEEEEYLFMKEEAGAFIDASCLTLTGVKIDVKFVFEKDDDPNRFNTRTKAPWERDKDDDDNTKPKSFISRLVQEEFGRLKRAAVSNLLDSELLQHLSHDVLDAVSIKVFDLVVEIVAPFTGSSIKLGADYIANISKWKESGPLMQDLSWKLLYVDLHTRHKKRGPLNRSIEWVAVHPIIEPFNYKATIRRRRGTRFRTTHGGFEIIGMGNYADYHANPHYRRGHGIIIHRSDMAVKAFGQVADAFKGHREPDYDKDVYGISEKAPTGVEKWPISARIMILLVCLVATSSALYWLELILRFFGVVIINDNLLKAKRFIGLFLFVVQTILVMKVDLDRSGGKASEMKQKDETCDANLQRQQAFRLPFPFVTVVFPGDTRYTIKDLSLIGRIDFKKVFISAESFSIASGNANGRGLTASMKGVRAIYNHGKLLANIDLIDDLHVPGAIHLLKPIEDAVIIFDGKLTVKLKALHGQILSKDGPDEEIRDEEEIQESIIRAAIQKTEDTINASRKKVKEQMRKQQNEIQKRLDKFRQSKVVPAAAAITDQKGLAELNRFNAEIYELLVKLQVTASMFERIPLQSNRENLRLYRNSFRGKDAVNFVLENQMAENRLEAIKLLKSLEIEFGLFENVTKECRFRDDPHALYRFIPKKNRRFWTKNDLQEAYDWIESFDRAPEPTWIPLPITILALELFLNKIDDDGSDNFVSATRAELYLEPGKLSAALDATIIAGEMKSKMVSCINGRARAIFHPKLPKLIHRLQLSFDSLHVNSEYTIEDWFDHLTFMMDDDDTDPSEDLSTMPASEEEERPKNPLSFPYAYVSDFMLLFSWKGTMISTDEAEMKVDSFVGTDSTTLNNLLKYLIQKVLHHAPYMIFKIKFMGVNVFGSGLAAAVNATAHMVPGGTAMSIGVLAVYDAVCGVLDAGKEARQDPTGKHQWGDFGRGLFCAAGGLAREGAALRGKTDEDFFDDDDKVKIDPLDFAFGAVHQTINYTKENKARFAGAYVGGAVTVAGTVFLGPWGIVLGAVAGAGTEAAVNLVDKNEPQIRAFGKKWIPIPMLWKKEEDDGGANSGDNNDNGETSDHSDHGW